METKQLPGADHFRYLVSLVAELKTPKTKAELTERFDRSVRQLDRDLILLREIGFEIEETIGPYNKKWFRVVAAAKTFAEITYP